MKKAKPQVDLLGKYELREAAESLDVHKSTIDRWTRLGIMACTIRKSNGRRVWTGAEILRMWNEVM